MAKKIFLPILSAFLIGQSYKLISNIHKLEINSLIVLFLIAWVINMFITGIFAFMGFAYPTQKLLPKKYYQIHKPEKLKYVYGFFRVDWFRRFLLATFWKSPKDRKRFFNGKRTGIANLEEQTMKSEFGHLMPFLIINAIGIYLIMIQLYALGLFTILWNVIGNMYPIILQRYHRMRIQYLKNRQPLTKSIG